MNGNPWAASSAAPGAKSRTPASPPMARGTAGAPAHAGSRRPGGHRGLQERRPTSPSGCGLPHRDTPGSGPGPARWGRAPPGAAGADPGARCSRAALHIPDTAPCYSRHACRRDGDAKHSDKSNSDHYSECQKVFLLRHPFKLPLLVILRKRSDRRISKSEIPRGAQNNTYELVQSARIFGNRSIRYHRTPRLPSGIDRSEAAWGKGEGWLCLPGKTQYLTF